MTVQKQILHEGVPVTYTVTGSGPPVMLLHGFAEDGRIWKYQLSALAGRYRVIIPDLPGSGLSPVNLPVMTMEGMARALRQVLDAEEISTVAMLGHSMGGYITLAFAELFAERLSGLGLVHSTAFADTPEKLEARQKSIALIEEYGAMAFLRQSIPNLFSPAFVEQHRQEVDELVAAGSVFKPEALIQYHRAMMHRPNRSNVLKSSLLPVLFVIGEQDKAVPPADSLKQCHLPALSYIYMFKNAAHMGMWEERDEVNEAIKKFVLAI